MEDADDVIFVFGDDGEAGMGGFYGVVYDAFDAVSGFDDIHLGSAHHGIADVEAAESEGFGEPLCGIGIQCAAFNGLMQKVLPLFGGFG